MKVMGQLAMVMNLDKCIGCHTCSVTCKQTWTNRAGMEYAWFNNVETRPGQGYPRTYQDQDKWRGGWELNRRDWTLGQPGEPWTAEARELVFEARPTARALTMSAGLPGYAVYYVGETPESACLYRRQDFTIHIGLLQPASEPASESAPPEPAAMSRHGSAALRFAPAVDDER